MPDQPHDLPALPSPASQGGSPPAAGPPGRFAGVEPAEARHGAAEDEARGIERLFARLRSAIELALSSGVADAADAAYERALGTHGRLAALDLPDAVRASLDGFVADLRERFPTARLVNAAFAEVERAALEPEPELQRPHLEAARAALAAGLGATGVDRAEVEAMLAEIDAALARIDDATAPVEVEVERPTELDLSAMSEALDVRPRAALRVDIEAAERVHTTMLARRGAAVLRVLVTNAGEEPVTGLTLSLRSTPALVLPSAVEIGGVEPGATLEFGQRRLAAFVRYDRAVLAGLTEPTDGTLVAEVLDRDGRTLATTSHEWRVLPDDTWPGLGAAPEGLAAFVLPNDPGVVPFARSAAEALGRSTGSNALDGYQSRDPHRALRMVEAVFAAIAGAGITYANPPASFERDGQRVRFPDAIGSTRLATCLDLALLAAAVLEQAGLHPIVVLVDGHAFTACWLVEHTFQAPATDEVERLRSRLELTELVAFDPTVATGAGATFDAARAEALQRLADPGDLFVAVDVRRARLGGVLPIATAGAERTYAPGMSDGTSDAADVGPSRDLDADVAAYLAAERRRQLTNETPATRLDRWLRQLLDLSMRNRLLNAGRVTKRTLPLFPAEPGPVEDRLARGEALRVAARPTELDGVANPTDADLEPLRSLFDDGAARGQLFAPFTERELGERLLHLYREARTAREEGGASGLYLTIGTLVYFEAKGSDVERRAPLLLLPVELKRDSARSGYTFVQGADEPRANVTLLEALRRDHDIDIVGLDPLPTDESGVDVPLVLRLVKDAIKNAAGWRVEDSLAIGLYSFAKYLLWRDLNDRADTLARNALVEHLIERPGEPFATGAHFPEPNALDAEVRAAEVFAPLSYDSTQLSAILAAAGGATLVLEGPPGTGKSQTITNLIAHAIANDRTVLFVSEKVAALEVVHRRLVGLGLGPACLELHSAKSSKKAVLAQFEEALEAGRQRGAKRRSWDEVAEELEAARAALNAHVDALHRERASGHTLHELVGELARERGRVEPLDVDLGDPLALDGARLKRWRALLDDLDVHGLEQGVGPEHPLLLVGRDETSPLFETEARRDLAAFDAPAERFAGAATALVEALDVGALPAPASREAWGALGGFADALVAAGETFDAEGAELWLARSDALGAVERDLDAAEELARLGAAHSGRFRASPATLDLGQLESLRREWAAGGLLKRWLRKRSIVAAFRGIAHDPSAAIDVEDAVRVLDEAQRVLELEAVTPSPESRAVLGRDWSVEGAESARDRARLELARSTARATGKLAAALGAAPRDVAAAARPFLAGERATTPLTALSVELGAAGDAYAAALDRAREIARPTERAPEPWPVEGVARWRGHVAGWFDAWARHRGWTRWAHARAAALEAGLAEVVEHVEDGVAEAGTLRERFEAKLGEDLALHEISADAGLRAFEGVEHARAIARFQELDDEGLSVAREEIIQRVARRRPTRAEREAEAPSGRAKPQGGLALLQRELAKKARHVATRKLLAALGEDAMRLKPCFLMSPMSVAQYLEPDHPPFDLVVFDEASQIPVWDAVGAIARGRQAVVVGDPKQLPPTSFFARASDGEDLDEEEVEDLESILDECIAAGVPVRRLAWHYRSRDESLIAFSNERYYDGELVTFPSSARDRSGVSLRYVKEGVYEKGSSRTNPIEARGVVDEVVRRLGDPEESSSIGVVTFNQAQQTLILDLLDAALRERPELERHFAEGTADGVFVKNLENVQGDERDVIVFSIGYGPDATGRVSMNFGPLNKDGGERRLNVAITRARREVLVFTSLRSDQIDPARTTARGVNDLRAFLRYAEQTSSEPHARQAAGEPRGGDVLVDAIAARLCERGHTVRTHVGRSGVRVDLAIVDPGAPERFLLGIETDGLNYARSATARDRDRLRADVLGSLGWRLHRVWAVDWWRDPNAVLEGIEDALGRT